MVFAQKLRLVIQKYLEVINPAWDSYCQAVLSNNTELRKRYYKWS